MLKELAPSLQTGILEVTGSAILGYNENKGMSIALRLRTDDLESFRHYHMIIDTLLHELAHMVHSDHDKHFYKLNRELEKVLFDKLLLSKYFLFYFDAGGTRRSVLFID